LETSDPLEADGDKEALSRQVKQLDLESGIFKKP
jgi:hypothetical protein